ncbi:MAG: hypothetical protein C4297_00440 [Gemmataceae bacterium]
MAWPIAMYSAPWASLSLEEVARRASEWGYQALELAAWTQHLDLQAAISEPDAVESLRAILEQYDLQAVAIHVGWAPLALAETAPGAEVRRLWPQFLAQSEAPALQAQQTLCDAVTLAAHLQAGTVVGWTLAPPLWMLEVADTCSLLRDFYARQAPLWQPVLQRCREQSVRLALVPQPGQLVWDLFSAELLLHTWDVGDELAFALDPTQLFWQGVDPAEFVRSFSERIAHVYVRDIAMQINGRRSVVCQVWPPGDKRRGWDYRCPGRGAVDWEALIRALHSIQYRGPLSVYWCDPVIGPEFGLQEACQFAHRLNFPTVPTADASFELDQSRATT